MSVRAILDRSKEWPPGVVEIETALAEMLDDPKDKEETCAILNALYHRRGYLTQREVGLVFGKSKSWASGLEIRATEKLLIGLGVSPENAKKERIRVIEEVRPLTRKTAECPPTR